MRKIKRWAKKSTVQGLKWTNTHIYTHTQTKISTVQGPMNFESKIFSTAGATNWNFLKELRN